MNDQQLRVWHIPQIPGKAFYVEVSSVQEGVNVMDILANYDLFQLKHNIKPDYANAQGLEVFEVEENDWVDWVGWSIDTNIDYFDDPRLYLAVVG